MSTQVRLNNFSDFDRLLMRKNFFLTLIGALGSFALSYFQIYIPLPIPPYRLSLALGLMIATILATKNIASAGIISLVGSIGILSVSGETPDFVVGYIIVNFVVMMLLAIYADRLRLVMDWVRFNLVSALILSLTVIGTGVLFNPLAERYWSEAIQIGNGGDPRAITDLPITDAIVAGAVFIIIMFFLFLLRGEILLDDSSIGKYRWMGRLFILSGMAITFVPLFLYIREIQGSTLSGIAEISNHLVVLEDLFLHQSGGFYPVFLNPFNIFFIIPLTLTLSAIGTSLTMIASNGGNLEGTRGRSNIIYLFAPLSFLGYFIYASYPVQNYIIPGGFFISLELFPVFAATIWIVYYINQVVAHILLVILD